MPRGGKREGAGRPKKEPTKRVSVPVSLIDKVKNFINKIINNEKKIEETPKKTQRPF